MPDHPTQNAVGFFDNYFDFPVTVVAYFIIDGNEDKLARIVLGYEKLDDKQYRNIFGRHVSILNTKYGKPKYSTNDKSTSILPEYRLSKLIVWKTSHTVINALLALSEDGSANSGVGIALGDRDKDPISKQWGWIDKT